MKKKHVINRRKAIFTLSSLGALLLPACSKKLPPTYGNILRMADDLTYVAHRTLLPGQALAREYKHTDISSFPATGTTNPADPVNRSPSKAYGNLQVNAFRDWTLSVEGRVSRPSQ